MRTDNLEIPHSVKTAISIELGRPHVRWRNKARWRRGISEAMSASKAFANTNIPQLILGRVLSARIRLLDKSCGRMYDLINYLRPFGQCVCCF